MRNNAFDGYSVRSTAVHHIPNSVKSSIVDNVVFSQLVRQVPELGRSSMELLFHGTRYAPYILSDNALKAAKIGDPVVCFTRSFQMARYWASLPRDDDTGFGAILVLDRRRLRQMFRLEPCHDPMWDGPGRIHDEMEERIWDRDVVDLDRYLLCALYCA